MQIHGSHDYLNGAIQRHTQVLELAVAAMIRRAQTLATQKDNTRPPDVASPAHGVRDDRLQSLTVTRRDGEGDTCADLPLKISSTAS